MKMAGRYEGSPVRRQAGPDAGCADRLAVRVDGTKGGLVGTQVLDHGDEPHQRRGDDVGRGDLEGAGEAAAACLGPVGVRAVQPVSTPARGLHDGHIAVGQGADRGRRSGDDRLGQRVSGWPSRW